MRTLTASLVRPFLVAVIASFLSLAFLAVAPSAHAATSFSGTIMGNTTWSASGNPYTVGNVHIPAGVTLTIEPGVEVRMLAYAQVDVAGSIIAGASGGAPVTILGASTAPGWNGFTFRPTSIGSFTAVEIAHTGSCLANCTGAGMHIDSGTVILRDMHMHDDTSGVGVLVAGNSALTVSGTEFSTMANAIVGQASSIVSVTGSSFLALTGTAVGAGGNSLVLTDNDFTNVARAAAVSASTEFTHSGNTAPTVRGGYFEMSGTLTGQRTWTGGDLPYRIQSLFIPSGTRLTIEADTVIKLPRSISSAIVTVDGDLVVNGTAEHNVLFTSDCDPAADAGGNNCATDPASTGPGDWSGILFRSGASTLTNTEIRYGGYCFFNCIGSTLKIDGGSVTLDHSWVHHDAHDPVVRVVNAATFSVVDSEFSHMVAAIVGQASSSVSVTGSNFHDLTSRAVNVGGASLVLTNNTFTNVSRVATVGVSTEFTHSGNTAPTVRGGYFEMSGTLSGQRTWTGGDLPYRVQNVFIPAGNTLSIEAGAVVKFARGISGALLTVDGDLVVNGTAENNVLFTSDCDPAADAGGNNCATDPASTGPGDWSGILFRSGASTLTNTEIRYGGYCFFNCIGSTLKIDGGSVTLDHTWMHHDAHSPAVRVAGTGAFSANNVSEFSHMAAAIQGLDASTIVVHQSSFHDLTGFGVGSASSVQANATSNWWGDATGPQHATNPGGIGEPVSGNVLFMPWLGVPPSSDITAPSVEITAGPSGSTYQTTAEFAFISDDPTATFRCRLDTPVATGAYLPCTSPVQYADLEGGAHAFRVVARDAAENESEAVREWEVETRMPVVLVPGIAGSHLYDGAEHVWMDIERLKGSLVDSFLTEHLLLDENGNEQRDEFGNLLHDTFVGDVVRYVDSGLPFNLYDIDSFQGLITALEARGYVEGQDLFVAPYDWRLDLDLTRTGLQQGIEAVKSQTGAPKVDVIAHSMGGLLVKGYLEANGDASVDKLIFVGTPHVGAPKAAKMIAEGDYLDKIGVVNPQRLREIGRNSPSLYQLLPQAGYFAAAPSYIEAHNPALSGAGNPLTRQQIKDYLLAHDANPVLLDRADAYEARGLADMTYAGVNAYNFSSCDPGGSPVLYLLDENGHIRDIFHGPGDGTVPLASSDAVDLPNARKFHSGRGEHPELPSFGGVRDAIVGIVADNDLSAAVALAAGSTDCALHGRQVVWRSPVEVHVYDSQGRHTGPIDNGALEFGIPSVRYDIIGHEKFLFIPTVEGETYRIEAVGTDDGTFDLSIAENEGGTITRTTVFNDVPVTTATEVTFDLTAASSDDTIQVSTAGGAPQPVAATMVNDGTVQSDFIPPVTTVQTSGTAGANGWFTSAVTVTLSATDDASGVHRMLYAIDGGAYQEYATPFAVTGDGTHTVRYYSVDNFGTNEDVREVVIKVDATAPVTSFTETPEALTNAATARFSFVAVDAGDAEAVTFACSLDGAVFAPCASPVELPDIADGVHALVVQATDAAGNVEEPPVTYAWTIDTAPPLVIITAPVDGSYTNQATIAATGTADDAGGSGIASVSLGGAPCSITGSNWTCAGVTLVGGANPLTVTATDLAGNAAEAAATVTVDTDVPDTTIDAAPQTLTHATTATFAFSATEAGATFECSLDGSAFAPCQSPLTHAALPDGVHVFAVRARDAAGNVDEGPAEHAWQVDATAPEITITTILDDLEQGDVFTPEFFATDGGSSIVNLTATLNGSPILSGETVTLTLAGNNILVANATDAAGNATEETVVFNVLGVTLLIPTADTYVRQGHPNQPMGDEDILRLTEAGQNRALLSFGLGAFLGTLPAGAVIESAALTLPIHSNADNWGQTGRLVGIHRLTKDWTEGGATWNCATDAIPTNHRADCSGASAWEMGKPNHPEFHPWIESATSTGLVTNDTLGSLAFDVTVDAASFLASPSLDHGWIVMKEEEHRTGRMTFSSKESGVPSTLRVMWRVE